MKNFEYLAFVDASGDDGFKLEDGSSPCFVACLLITKISDKGYNLKILDEVKKIGKIPDQNELKWTSFKRQKDNRFKALKKLCDLKSHLVFSVALKKRITDRSYINDPKKKKLLTSFIHEFCLETTFRICLKTDKKAYIYIDRMKQVEQNNVKALAKYTTNDDGDIVETDHNEKVIISYVDSKAEKLIQAADFFSGALRSFFEKYDETWPWPLRCDFCNPPTFLCSYSRKEPPSQLKMVGYWKAIYPIMGRDEDGVLDISTIPPELMDKKMRFLECAGQGKAT